MPRYAIIEAPSVLGLFPGGVEQLPDALLDAGLAERLEARHAGAVMPGPYDPTRDPTTGLLNPQGLRDHAHQLSRTIRQALDSGEVPVVLGGDCSVLLGSLLALRSRGRYGLLFVDGHADFYQPEAEPRGEVASMVLAIATGRGPTVLTQLAGSRPLVHDEDVVHFARRDHAEAVLAGSQRIEESGITLIDLPAVRDRGAHCAARDALGHLQRPELDGFWVHVDCDALDDGIMPAVDYRLPGGLSWDEWETVLRTASQTGGVAGLDVTIFNPVLDRDGSIAQAVVHHLSRAFSEGASSPAGHTSP